MTDYAMNTTGLSKDEASYMRRVFDLIDRVNTHIEQSEHMIVDDRPTVERMIVDLRDALMFVLTEKRR